MTNDTESASPNLSAATIRTALPAGWAAVAIWALDKFTPVHLAADDLVVLAPVAVVITGIVYRAAREIEARWPIVGRIFLGSSKTPTY